MSSSKKIMQENLCSKKILKKTTQEIITKKTLSLHHRKCASSTSIMSCHKRYAHQESCMTTMRRH